MCVRVYTTDDARTTLSHVPVESRTSLKRDTVVNARAGDDAGTRLARSGGWRPTCAPRSPRSDRVDAHGCGRSEASVRLRGARS